MEQNNRIRGQQIIEEYLNKIRLFLEKEKEWWSVASKWNDLEYGRTLEISLEIAKETLKTILGDANLEKEYNKFYRSVVSLYNLTISIDKNSMMIGKIISSAGNNNAEISSLALTTLKELKSYIEIEFPNSQMNWSMESPRFNILKPGSNGNWVKEIQSALKKLQYYKSAIDGNYGEITTSSVKEFQERNNLPSSGEVDEKTYNSIRSQLSGLKEDQIGYWILKINPSTWNIPRLEAGKDAWFHTFNLEQEKRPEYDLFQKVRPGDKVIGYAFENYNSVVCIFEVKNAVQRDPQLGECIILNIEQVLGQFKPLASFSEQLPFEDKLSRSSPLRLFAINHEQYMSIIESKSNIPEKYHSQFLPFFNSEGRHNTTDDRLDFKNDINSFATVISLSDVKPPLAIGLFGNWGSGKSFFMEKLMERIEEITESHSDGFIQNVVHVKFNSWHYSDTSLLASLTAQIFESLHDFAKKKSYGEEAIQAIYENLNLTSYQIEETKKKLADNEVRSKVLTEKKSNIEDVIKQKKESLSIWTAKDLVQVVLTDPYIKGDFQDLKTQFNDEKLIDNINQIEEKFAQIDTVGGQIMQSFKLLKKNHKGNWKWIWILAILFGLLSWLALGPLKHIIQDYINGVYIVSAMMLGWLTNLLTKLSPYLNKINQFYKRLKSLKKTIEIEKDKVRLKEHDEVDRLTKELNCLISEKATIEIEHNQIEEKKRLLQNEIRETGSGKLLASFLESKSNDDAYIKQLGIISWIRKDFSKLDELFQRQRTVQVIEHESKAEVQIDRIVLYIDDLDRCNEEVVVKVLESIHLLLAFPLFVVIVGVDPRWLNNAIANKYKNLFGVQNSKMAKNKPGPEIETFLSGTATSYDYLEKIFQIPFSLKSINKSNRENLIRYLLRNEMELPVFVKNTNGNIMSPATFGNNAPNEQVKTDTLGTSLLQQSALSEKTPPENEIKMVKLTFLQQELDFMQKVSALFGQTPRMINRYINIYRIIKSHQGLKITDKFSEDEFIPVMIVLGIIVGFPANAQNFIEELSKVDDETSFDEFIKNTAISKIVKEAIANIIDANLKEMKVEPFKRNLDLISRFSFRTIMS